MQLLPEALSSGQVSFRASSAANGSRASLEPLATALAAGRTVFAGSPVTAQSAASARGTRRLQAKMRTIFGAFPDVAVGDQGVRHEIGQLPFIDLTMMGATHLVGCGQAGEAVPLSPRIPVDIVTGTCLFGAESVLGWVDGSGYPMTIRQVVETWDCAATISRVTTDSRLHVYELETLARLGAFIRGLIRLYGRSAVRVRACIPLYEYEAYGLSLYACGVLSAKLYAQYRKVVRWRAWLISRMLRSRLRGGVEVTADSPLSPIRGLDISRVPPAGLPKLVHDALSRQDPLWRDLLAAGILAL